MENTIYPPEQTEQRFWHWKLPLLLIPVVLLLFNYFLYSHLQADGDDGGGEVISAETTTDITTSAAQPEPKLATQAAAIPNDGLNLQPAIGNLGDSGWHVIRGEWLAEERGLRQIVADKYDLAASYKAERFETYAFETSIQHLVNVGGGVYFNMQSFDSTATSHMLRFEADGSAIFWGYFDDVSQFTGQGFANIDVDMSQIQQLRIDVHSDTFDVVLNGLTLAADIPLVHRGGHVGLMASESEVLFERVRLVPIDGIGTAPAVQQEFLPETTELLEQVETVTGEWIYQEGTIRQVRQEATDYITMLNTLGKSYMLRATVQLPDKNEVADSGAGFVFHMPERDKAAGGHMVRLLDGGEQVMWGEFDMNGNFIGKGNIRTELDPTVPHEIAVHVHGVNFDIAIDGKTLVTELPLMPQEGWIGLVAYRGEVMFSDVNLTLGGE